MNGLRSVAAVYVGGCLLCFCGGPGPARAAQTDAVLQSIRQRAEALANFAVDVTVTETSYQGGGDPEARPAETLVREHHIVAQNGSFRETCAVRSSQAHGLNMQHATTTFPQEGGRGWVRQDLGESNGRKSLLTTHAGARGDFSHSCAWDAFLGAWGPTEYRNHPVALWGQDAQGEHYALAAATEECLVLRHQPDPRSDIYEMHVRKDLGYLVLQVSRFTPEGMLLEESRVSEYTFKEGVAVPQQIEFVAYGYWEGRPYRSLTRSLRINTVTLKPNMPDAYFHLEAADRGINDKLDGLRMASHELHDQDYLADLDPQGGPVSPPAGGEGAANRIPTGAHALSPQEKSVTPEDQQPGHVGGRGGIHVPDAGARWRYVMGLVGLVLLTTLLWLWKRKGGWLSDSSRPSPERSAQKWFGTGI